MADDIIDWLYDYSGQVDDCEINGRLTFVASRLESQQAEIERLRDELAAWQATVRAHDALAVERADEIERLRTAGDALAEFIGRRAGSSDKSHIRDEADEVCLLWEDAVKGGEFWEARRG